MRIKDTEIVFMIDVLMFDVLMFDVYDA